MDKISIVVAVYNAEKTLKKCVDSLLNQTYNNIEIILVNDCSKDNSLDICNEYSKANYNVKVISNNRNSGVSDTRNNGIDNSTGEYICFVDSDDYVESNYIEVLYYYYQKYNTVPICGFVYHDEYNHAKPVKYSWSGNEGLVSLGEAFKLNSELYLTALWNKLFNNNVIKENNVRFDETISMGEDLKFTLDYFTISNIDKVYVFSDYLYHYTKLSGDTLMSSFATSGINKAIERLKLIEKIAKKYNANAHIEYEKALSNLKCIYKYNILIDKSLSSKKKISMIKEFLHNYTYRNYIIDKAKLNIVNLKSKIKGNWLVINL